MKKIYTLQDARRERDIAGLEQAARWQAEDEANARIQKILGDNPQIGQIVRAGTPVYYTYPAGGAYREARDPAALLIEG